MNNWEYMASTWEPERRQRFGDAQADRHNMFRTEGYKMLPSLTQPKRWLQRLQGIAASKVDPAAPQISRYAIEDILQIGPLRDFATAPENMLWAAMHIGAVPVINDVSLWVTEPGDAGDAGAQRWHRDIDDWRATKLFVYLSDVDDENGPHEFIHGSHRHDFFEGYGQPPDVFFIGAGREMMPTIGATLESLPRIKITGPAGTAWMENTYCFHRGTPVRRGARVVFQVMYGLMDLEKEIGPGTNIPKIRKAWG